MKAPDADSAEATAVKRWIENFVVGHNLCPFARRELERDSIRVVSTDATTGTELKSALVRELSRLDADEAIQTTVLVHPHVFNEFADYNEFLGQVEDLLREHELEGIYQVASFHPHYRFANTQPADAENYTNRSPYPLLHILREESVERAIDQHSDVGAIPQTNIALMNQLGSAALREQLENYLKR